MRERATSYFHRSGDEPLLGVTIPEHFTAVVDRYPDREAVVSVQQGVRLTYIEFAYRVDELARGLMGMGFGKGDRIGFRTLDDGRKVRFAKRSGELIDD